MVSNVSSKGHSADHAGAAKAAKGTDREMPPQAKNMQSVGHLAKAAVALSGDTSPNAIGKAASLIARHMLDTAPPVEPPATEPPPPAPETEQPPVAELPTDEQSAALQLLEEETQASQG